MSRAVLQFQAWAVTLSLGILSGCDGSGVLGSGPPVTLEFVPGRAESGFVNAVVPAPRVRVLDADGKPLAGVRVRFAIDGGGALAWPYQYSDQRGHASAGGWRLGPSPGPQRILAETDEVAATATVEVLTTPQPAFTIALHYVRHAGLLDNDRLSIVRAALRWEEIVLGDLPDMVMPPTLPASCPAVGDLGGTPIDDLLVLVSAERLQGLAARTSICARRPGGGLPYVVTIRLDPGKASLSGGIRATMIHEIGHALGIGTLWGADVLDYDGDLRYGGAFATAAFELSAGLPASTDDRGVPVQSTGGEGVARVHWSESVFGPEILTPFPPDPTGFEPISGITVAALRDLGYVVDESRADPFSLGSLARVGKVLDGRGMASASRQGVGISRP